MSIDINQNHILHSQHRSGRLLHHISYGNYVQKEICFSFSFNLFCCGIEVFKLGQSGSGLRQNVQRENRLGNWVWRMIVEQHNRKIQFT